MRVKSSRVYGLRHYSVSGALSRWTRREVWPLLACDVTSTEERTCLYTQNRITGRIAG